MQLRRPRARSVRARRSADRAAAPRRRPSRPASSACSSTPSRAIDPILAVERQWSAYLATITCASSAAAGSPRSIGRERRCRLARCARRRGRPASGARGGSPGSAPARSRAARRRPRPAVRSAAPQSGQVQLPAHARGPRGRSSGGSARAGRRMSRVGCGASTDSRRGIVGSVDRGSSDRGGGASRRRRAAAPARRSGSSVSAERPKRQRRSRITSALSASMCTSFCPSRCSSTSIRTCSVATSRTRGFTRRMRACAALLHAHDARAITSTCMRLPRAFGPSPVDALEQHRQLRGRQVHGTRSSPAATRSDRARAASRTGTALAVRPQQLDQIAALAAEHEHVATMRIALSVVFHERREPVHAAAHVGHAGGQPDLRARRQRDHERRDRQSITTCSASRDTLTVDADRAARQHDLQVPVGFERGRGRSVPSSPATAPAPRSSMRTPTARTPS